MTNNIIRICFSSLLFFISILMNGQFITPTQIDFLNKNAIPISLNNQSSNQNWEKIGHNLKGKRLILLGEFNHGSREVFLLRNEMIKYLHEEHDFDVILFEAGLGELITIEMEKETLSSKQMTYGFFSGWRTSEFRELMKYVKSEKISIAGFDVQRTGGSFSRNLSELSTIANIDSIHYHHLEKEYGMLKKELTYRKIKFSDSLQFNIEDLLHDYEILYAKILDSSELLPFKKSWFTLKAIENRVNYLKYMLQFKIDNDWNKRWAARDSSMANNVEWLVNNIYRNKKIIIVGHNFHISKHNEKEEVMGEFLKRRFEKEMYAIGIFAQSGKYLDNYGRENELIEPDNSNLDIKHIVKALGNEISFIPILEKPIVGDEWMRKSIIINDTFIDLSNSNSLILSKNFDALFLLHNVSSPKK
ncbi:MAG: erythromycin esterase family protein [Saprospiraceae bacterium]